MAAFMNRNDFINRLARYLLMGLLGGAAVLAGRRVSLGNDCSACPGKGICKGEEDCSKYISDIYGRK